MLDGGVVGCLRDGAQRSGAGSKGLLPLDVIFSERTFRSFFFFWSTTAPLLVDKNHNFIRLH